MINGRFKKGEPRPTGAGRKAGTPNKRTQTVVEMVEASGKNPITVMLDLLDDNDPNLRLAAAKELAQYLFPKRKHLDVDALTTSIIAQPQRPLTDEQLIMLVSRARGSGDYSIDKTRPVAHLPGSEE